MKNTCDVWNHCAAFQGTLPCDNYHIYFDEPECTEACQVFEDVAFRSDYHLTDAATPSVRSVEDIPYLRPAYQSDHQECVETPRLGWHTAATYSFAMFPPARWFRIEEFVDNAVMNVAGVVVKDVINALLPR